MEYDYLIVGSGLFGAVTARQLTDRGYNCLVIDKRSHIGGNVYTENVDGIEVHKYGAHIFHTSNKEVWDYVNKYVEFYPYINSPMALSKGKIYNLPFNMNTFYQLYGVTTPEDARKAIQDETEQYKDIDPKNLEEQALKLGGKTLYEALIKGYSEKQWGRDAKQIPAFIIRRLPFRFTYNNNYFNDLYQGIPKYGYTQLIKNLLNGIDIRLNTDYFIERSKALATNRFRKGIIYTGKLDEFFDCKFGNLEYRSLHFETYKVNQNNHQGNAVVNYVDKEVPYTRVIEHKHFTGGDCLDYSLITKEFPHEFSKDNIPYYPMNSPDNELIANKYKELVKRLQNIWFGGRLADFKYYDMHITVEKALKLSKELCELQE